MVQRRMTRRRVLALGSALAATAALAACGQAEDEDAEPTSRAGNGSNPTATPTNGDGAPTATSGSGQSGLIEYPTGADDLVVKARLEGGFVMPDELARRVPIAALYGDGRLIYPGPQIEIFPPPALPNMLVLKLNERGMQEVLVAAMNAGLLDGDARYDTMTVTDVPDTVFEVNAGGQSSTVSVYALGFNDDDPSMPAEEREARKKLARFLDFLTSVPHEFDASLIAEPEQSYEIERLQLIIHDHENMGPDDLELQELAWPLSASPNEIGDAISYPAPSARCATLEGGQLDTMLAELENANTLTKWMHDEQAYFVIPRPLLPDEEGCDYEKQPTPETPSGEYTYPSNSDEVVLRYSIEGGFVPLEHFARHIPEVSLFGDGMMVTPGVQIAIYPPPAMPALSFDYLSEEGIQFILAEADAAGLMAGDQTWDEATNFVADAGTGVLTITAGGRTSTVSVYAPSMTGLEDMVSPEEIEFRAQFDAFISKLMDPASWLPEGSFVEHDDEYPLDRLQIISQPLSASPFQDPDVEPDEVDWPLETSLAEVGEPAFLEESRCFVLEGEDYARVISMLWQASQLTRWNSAGEQYILYARPLLPDEEGCIDPFA